MRRASWLTELLGPIVLVVVLLLRPQGLFARTGQGSVERV